MAEDNTKVLIPELLKQLSEETGLQVKQIRAVIDRYHSSIINHVEKGRPVAFAGFGQYVPKIMAPKRVLNNSTATVVYTDERMSMKFVPSQKIVQRLTLSLSE